MFRWWVLGCEAIYLCMLCGEMWDQEIAMNRWLQKLGCRTPEMFCRARAVLRQIDVRKDTYLVSREAV